MVLLGIQWVNNSLQFLEVNAPQLIQFSVFDDASVLLYHKCPFPFFKAQCLWVSNFQFCQVSVLDRSHRWGDHIMMNGINISHVRVYHHYCTPVWADRMFFFYKTLSYVMKYCTQDSDNVRSIVFELIKQLHEHFMECVFWVFNRKLTTIYREILQFNRMKIFNDDDDAFFCWISNKNGDDFFWPGTHLFHITTPEVLSQEGWLKIMWYIHGHVQYDVW